MKRDADLQGLFASPQNWWSRSWLEKVASWTDPGRMRRGLRLALVGGVDELQAANGSITAVVTDNSGRAWRVTMNWPELSDPQWSAIFSRLAARALFTAPLLAGELPAEIEEEFAFCGASFFPARLEAWGPRCPCPDWSVVCKHITAANYLFAAQFNEDPFLLFQVRGRTQSNVLAALRDLRRGREMPATADSDTRPGDQPQTFAEGIDDFWGMGTNTGPIPFSIQEPPAPLPVLHRLGQPTFVDRKVEELWGPWIKAVSAQALAVAYQMEWYDPDTDE